MNNDYKELAEKLQVRLNGLLERADEIEDDLRHPLDADSSEQAVDLADDESLEGVDDVLRAEVQQIRLALQRIENGSYGTCAACGKDCQVPFEPRNGRPVYCSDCFSSTRR